MKISSRVILVVCCFLGLKVVAQDNTDNHNLSVMIPEVALLDLETSSVRNFTLEFTKPTEEGESIVNPPSNDNLWINYSSIKTASGADISRTVMVKINQNVSGGLTFGVMAGTVASGAIGTTGNFVGFPVSITTTNQALITGIGSCYTGTGPNFGHKLTYFAVQTVASYGDIRVSNQLVEVTYTLTDVAPLAN